MSDNNGTVNSAAEQDVQIPFNSYFSGLKENIYQISSEPFSKMIVSQWKTIFTILKHANISYGDLDRVSIVLMGRLQTQWRNYYYDSEVWKKIRDRKLYDQDGVCQICGGRAWVVHHLSYQRLGGNEKLTDLQALCGPCHDYQHPEHQVRR
jgi:hypothetical protein